MENNAQSSASAVRWMSRFALIVWTACFIAVLLRILTIHPLDPYATPFIDAFENIFLALLCVSAFENIFLLPLKPPSKEDLARQLPASFLDSFLNVTFILSWICMLAGAAAVHFLGGVPMMQEGAYFIRSGREIVREIPPKWFAALSYLTSPISEKIYYDSISQMWWMLMLSSGAAYKMRRHYRIQAADTSISSDK